MGGCEEWRERDKSGREMKGKDRIGIERIEIEGYSDGRTKGGR